jgi:hypothetical protein
LADVFAFLAVGLDAAVVEAWAEVGELGGGVGEQVPGDGEYGSADGDDCFLFASSACQAPVAFAEEGGCPSGCDNGLAEDPGEVGLPRPVEPFPLLRPADSLTVGVKRAQDARCPAVGNLPMSVPISAMMTAAATGPMPGIC